MGLIPPFFLDCVVAIGISATRKKQKIVASGFLYGDFVSKKDEGTSIYMVYLVTNRHVFEGLREAWVRFNPQEADEPSREYRLPLLDKNTDQPLWLTHPRKEIDVALIPILISKLRQHAMQVMYFRSDKDAANTQKMKKLGFMEGDFAYALGFALGLAGRRRNVVIARSGTIARIRDALTGTAPDYLVDAFVFPGNSGGPVVSKPELVSVVGTKPQEKSYLIGIVKG